MRYDAINKLELKYDESSKNIYSKFNMACIYIQYILNTYISLEIHVLLINRRHNMIFRYLNYPAQRYIVLVRVSIRKK